MKPDVKPLIDAIDRYLAKADEDLAAELAVAGFVAPEDTVKDFETLEEGIRALLDQNADELLDALASADSAKSFLETIWPLVYSEWELNNALKEYFAERFTQMMMDTTWNWLLKDAPDFAPAIENFDITEYSKAWIEEWSGDLADLMKLSSKNQIEAILKKSVDKGWTVDETAQAIGDSGIRQCGYRSRRVALTETLRVQSYAHQESMRQDPLCYKKRWRQTYQAKEPRPNHIAMDGQEVFKEQPFTLTGADGSIYYPQCPRDTSLPASESVNCHCIMENVKNDSALGITQAEWLKMREDAIAARNEEYQNYVNNKTMNKYS